MIKTDLLKPEKSEIVEYVLEFGSVASKLGKDITLPFLDLDATEPELVDNSKKKYLLVHCQDYMKKS